VLQSYFLVSFSLCVYVSISLCPSLSLSVCVRVCVCVCVCWGGGGGGGCILEEKKKCKQFSLHEKKTFLEQLDNSVEIQTRCSFVIEFITPKFIEGWTCLERHTAHHQELLTVFAASDLYTHLVTGHCWAGNGLGFLNVSIDQVDYLINTNSQATWSISRSALATAGHDMGI
jgi:hypothetical protein